jgi:hypothetical protein
MHQIIQTLQTARRTHKMPRLTFRNKRTGRTYVFYIQNSVAAFFSYVGSTTHNTRLNTYDLTDNYEVSKFRAMCGRKIKFIRESAAFLAA